MSAISEVTKTHGIVLRAIDDLDKAMRRLGAVPSVTKAEKKEIIDHARAASRTLGERAAELGWRLVDAEAELGLTVDAQ